MKIARRIWQKNGERQLSKPEIIFQSIKKSEKRETGTRRTEYNWIVANDNEIMTPKPLYK